MAILENKTRYYKINYPECYIKNNSVYVNFDIYEDKGDRDREKQSIEEFDRKLEALRMSNNEELKAFASKLPEEISDEDFDEQGIIKNEELREEHIKLTKLQTAIHFAYDKIYGTVDVSHIDFSILEEYEIDMLLIENPIRLSVSNVMSTGEYNQEELTHEFFYNRLKTVMNKEIIEDC